MTTVYPDDLVFDSGFAFLDDTTIEGSDGTVRYGGQSVSFPNPGVPVIVDGALSCYAYRFGSPLTIRVDVRISFDGGGAYTSLRVGEARLGVDDTISSVMRAPLGGRVSDTGEPTGDIVVNVTAGLISAAETPSTLYQGALLAWMSPA